jgi:geranylgeranyl diphosphate synthase, type I
VGLPKVFEKFHTEIDAEIISIIAERQSPMYNMLRYHFGWMDRSGQIQNRSNGKAVRPTLCLLTCKAGGGDYQRALPAAAAIELVHNYSLIHDDIQDDDVERHHQPTVWHVWGKAQAINAGTAMRMLADVALRRLNVTSTQQIRIQSLIDEATIRIIEGQYLDIYFESKTVISISEYLEMVECKTAALIACAAEIGAELGASDRQQIESWRDLGWNLGMAFQTKDDILGIWGREKETGKPSGNDIRLRKKTLPIIFGLQNTTGQARETLLQCYRNETLDEDIVQAIVTILEKAGALEATQVVTEQYINQANKILDHLPVAFSAKQDLMEVINFFKTRTF